MHNRRNDRTWRDQPQAHDSGQGRREGDGRGGWQGGAEGDAGFGRDEHDGREPVGRPRRPEGGERRGDDGDDGRRLVPRSQGGYQRSEYPGDSHQSNRYVGGDDGPGERQGGGALGRFEGGGYQGDYQGGQGGNGRPGGGFEPNYAGQGGFDGSYGGGLSRLGGYERGYPGQRPQGEHGGHGVQSRHDVYFGGQGRHDADGDGRRDAYDGPGRPDIYGGGRGRQDIYGGGYGPPPGGYGPPPAGYGGAGRPGGFGHEGGPGGHRFGPPGPAPSHRGRGPKGYKRSDERIREEVCDRLTEHHEIDASDVSVDVNDGEVTLAGTVDERRVKHLIEHVVEAVAGVQEVHNRLRLRRDATRAAAAGAGAPGGEAAGAGASGREGPSDEAADGAPGAAARHS